MQTTPRGTVCPLDHQASELIGRRWTGVLIRAFAAGAVRCGDLSGGVPSIGDRVRSERPKNLEAEGLVVRWSGWVRFRIPQRGAPFFS
jgi:DNA-binding HxlR family transcriptional regulator